MAKLQNAHFIKNQNIYQINVIDQSL